MTRIAYVDYEKTRRKLEKMIREEPRTKTKVGLQILLVQLANGARISEAHEAYYKFCRDPSNREVYVRVRKKKRSETRLIIIPDVVKPINVKVHLNSVMRLARTRLKVNTHSLRYAFITFLAKQHIPYQLIAKITKHSKPDLVEYYTHELLAEQLLRKVASDGRRYA